MKSVDRHSALRDFMFIGAVASFGASLLPDLVEAMPLALQ
jgi:hypothetical protein